eukprot:7380076-Prymnesium_polylepis.1
MAAVIWVTDMIQYALRVRDEPSVLTAVIHNLTQSTYMIRSDACESQTRFADCSEYNVLGSLWSQRVQYSTFLDGLEHYSTPDSTVTRAGTFRQITDIIRVISTSSPERSSVPPSAVYSRTGPRARSGSVSFSKDQRHRRSIDSGGVVLAGGLCATGQAYWSDRHPCCVQRAAMSPVQRAARATAPEQLAGRGGVADSLGAVKCRDGWRFDTAIVSITVAGRGCHEGSPEVGIAAATRTYAALVDAGWTAAQPRVEAAEAEERNLGNTGSCQSTEWLV